MAFNFFELEEYRLISGVAFSIGLSIRCIYILASNKLYILDWNIVGCLMLIFLIISAITLIVVQIYRKPVKFRSFSSIVAILSIDNSVITGIPILNGIYDQNLVSKYAYVQMLPCFLFCLIIILIFFELSNNPERLAEAETKVQKKKSKIEGNIKTKELQQQNVSFDTLKAKLTLSDAQEAQKHDREKYKQSKVKSDKIKKVFMPIAKALLKAIASPLVLAMIFGIIFNGILQPKNAEFPAFMTYLFEYQGFIAAPLGLLMIGMYLYKEFYEMLIKRKEKKIREKHDDGIKSDLTPQIASVSLQTHTTDTVINENQEKMIKTKKHIIKLTDKQYDIIVYIVLTIYIQLMKHIITPILFTVIAKSLNINDELIVELNTVMWAQPTAVYSFVLCTQYGFGQELAGFDSVFGIFTSFLVIPMLQVYTRNTYGKQ